MSDDPPLPDLSDALLDADTLSALFSDLEAHARVLGVMTKGQGAVRADGQSVGLRDAQVALASGQVRAVQITYQFDGDEWRDTLMTTPDGVRLVRMKMGT